MFDLGEVLLWKDFPLQRDGWVKNRYFIYIGNSPIFSVPANWYGISTTTRYEYYATGAEREGNNHIIIEESSYGFPSKSIVDVDKWFEGYYMETLQQNINKITIIGRLDNTKLIEIYKLIFKSGQISMKIKTDIYECYKNNSITGIEKPQKRRKSKY